MQIIGNDNVLQKLQQLPLSSTRLARSTLRILVLKMLRLGNSRILIFQFGPDVWSLKPKCVSTIAYSSHKRDFDAFQENLNALQNEQIDLQARSKRLLESPLQDGEFARLNRIMEVQYSGDNHTTRALFMITRRHAS